MFKIYKGGEYFYQWDIGQRLLIEDPEIVEVHFCNQTGDCALVTLVYKKDGVRLANVPNILLQNTKNIRVYGCIEEGTNTCFAKDMQIFRVIPRGKPDDYMYEETVVRNVVGKPYVVDGVATGEIFNDCENNIAAAPYSHAEGKMSTVGSKGFRIVGKSKNSDTNTTSFFTKDITGLNVGDIVSIQLDSFYPNCGKIKDLGIGKSPTPYVIIDTVIEEEFNADITDSKIDKNVLRVLSNPDLGDVYLGTGAHAEGEKTQAFTRAGHAEGKKTKVIGDAGHAEGEETVASYAAHAEGTGSQALGFNSHAEGSNTTATGDNSHAEGIGTQATAINAHAEGAYTEATMPQAHAEGYGTKAKNTNAHAEGNGSQALGEHSHAEGNYTYAIANTAHAEGDATWAKGFASHAEGSNTVASGAFQHVQGRFNVEDTVDRYAHIVGGGTAENDRKNIHTLDWVGNAEFAGAIEGTALILKSPNGKRFKITVSDTGTLTTTAI